MKEKANVCTGVCVPACLLDFAPNSATTPMEMPVRLIQQRRFIRSVVRLVQLIATVFFFSLSAAQPLPLGEGRTFNGRTWCG